MFQYNRNLLEIRPSWSTPPTPVGPWIYWSASLWLISASSDGTTWTTIADKNVWATTVWQNWDTIDANNSGYFFQWWNNYGFPFTWATTTSSTWASIAGKSWSNPYSSSTFITTTGNTWTNWQSWESTVNNLWWNGTSTDIARQWPCQSWFHIPESSEVTSLYWVYYYIDPSNPSISNQQFFRLFLMPPSGYLQKNDGTHYIRNTWPWCYWSSSYIWGEEKSYSSYDYITWVTGSLTLQLAIAVWGSIRPFKNTSVTPDSSRVVLFQPSS